MSFSYVSEYASSALRGTDDPLSKRPWDITTEVLKYAGQQSKLLDIGCGTAFKLTPLSQHFREITGIDISEDMISAARNSIAEHRVTNIKLIHCDSNKLPFNENTYDVVTCMLSRWNINEIVRVLKPTGVVIVEHLGCEDKKDFKIHFGKDQHGWRGQFIEYQKEEYLQSYHDMFNQYFKSVSIKNGFWNTYYTKQGIIELLKFTPAIRNFDLANDSESIQKICAVFKRSQGIVLTQNRILIHAKKLRNF